MCIGMVRVKDGTDETRHDALFKNIVERVGLKHDEIAHATTFDRAAKGIATMLDHGEDACGARSFIKIGRSDIEDLIRTSSKAQHFSIFATFQLCFMLTQLLKLLCLLFDAFTWFKTPMSPFLEVCNLLSKDY